MKDGVLGLLWLNMIYEGSTARLVEVLTGTFSVLLTAFCSIGGIHFALQLFARYPFETHEDPNGAFLGTPGIFEKCESSAS